METFKNEVAQLKSQIGRSLKGGFLAGGAITSLFTNRKIRDYDLYFKDKPSFLNALQRMYDDGLWCVAITPRAVTFIENNETVYQLMSFAWFETAASIFEKFDFTCWMAAVDFEADELLRHPDFIRDVARRNLRFNHGTEFPIGSAMRVQKYQSRGYTIDSAELLKVMMACSFKRLTSWDELKNQIGGQYGEAITMDTTKDFTLENAIASLNDVLIDRPRLERTEGAASYREAVKTIFGESEKVAA